jgi:hypothetical protein
MRRKHASFLSGRAGQVRGQQANSQQIRGCGAGFLDFVQNHSVVAHSDVRAVHEHVTFDFNGFCSHAQRAALFDRKLATQRQAASTFRTNTHQALAQHVRLYRKKTIKDTHEMLLPEPVLDW